MERGGAGLTHAGRRSSIHTAGIAPLGLALDDEGFAADRELVAGARVRDVAGPHLEGGRLGMDAGLAEADDRVGSPGDHSHRDRLATRRRRCGVDPNAANVASTAPAKPSSGPLAHD